MFTKRWVLGGLTAAALLAGPIAAQQDSVPEVPRDFSPDWTFKGSQITGWQSLGEAAWRAEDGVVIGTPRAEAGGWLVLDRPLQDLAFFSRFRCAAACQGGVLVRAEKTADGLKGVLVSL